MVTINSTVSATDFGIVVNTFDAAADGILNITGGSYSGGTDGLLAYADIGGAMTLGISGGTFSGGPAITINATAGTITIGAFGGFTVTSPGGGVVINNVDFDVATAGGAIEIGTAADRVSGAGLSLTDVTGTLALSTLDVYSQGAAALSANNNIGGDNSTFMLNIAGGTVDADQGEGLVLNTITGDITLDAVNSDNSTTNAIGLKNLAGTIAVNGGTISNPNASAVRLESVAATAIFSGLTIDNPNDFGFEIVNPQGGSTSIASTVTGTVGAAIYVTTSSAAASGNVQVTGGSYMGTDYGFQGATDFGADR